MPRTVGKFDGGCMARLVAAVKPLWLVADTLDKPAATGRHSPWLRSSHYDRTASLLQGGTRSPPSTPALARCLSGLGYGGWWRCLGEWPGRRGAAIAERGTQLVAQHDERGQGNDDRVTDTQRAVDE